MSRDTLVLTESTYYILLCLTTPKHGYAMMQQIEQLTNGRVTIGPGTMYGVLKNLIEKRWIEVEDTTGRQKIYALTEEGRRVCLQEKLRLEEVLHHAKQLLEEESR